MLVPTFTYSGYLMATYAILTYLFSTTVQVLTAEGTVFLITVTVNYLDLSWAFTLCHKANAAFFSVSMLRKCVQYNICSSFVQGQHAKKNERVAKLQLQESIKCLTNARKQQIKIIHNPLRHKKNLVILYGVCKAELWHWFRLMLISLFLFFTAPVTLTVIT